MEDLKHVLSTSGEFGYVLSPLGPSCTSLGLPLVGGQYNRGLHGALINVPGRPELNGNGARAVFWVEALDSQEMSWVVISGHEDDYDEAFLVSDNNIDFGDPQAITVDINKNLWGRIGRQQFSREWHLWQQNGRNSNPTGRVTAKQLYEVYLKPRQT